MSENLRQQIRDKLKELGVAAIYGIPLEDMSDEDIDTTTLKAIEVNFKKLKSP